jgi:hypothetical protein
MIPTIPSKPASWRAAALIFTAMTIAVYFPVLRGKIPLPWYAVVQFSSWAGSSYVQPQPVADIGDLITAFYPFRTLAATSVRSGILPLWNPYILAGAPFLANSQSALFYPLTAFYYVLGLPAAWTFALIIRMFLSGLFMWLFVRSIGATQAGAIFSGIVFAGCGFMTAWQGQPMGDAAMWLPLIFYAVRRLRRDGSLGWIALTAIAFAMPVLAGHPETAAHLMLAGTAWALWLWIAPPDAAHRDFKYFLKFCIAGSLALGLASVQILPTLEWLREIGNTLDAQWPPLPLHAAFGIVSRDILRSPNSAGVPVPEAAAYVGMITLLLCPLAAFHKSRTAAAFLALLTAIACAAAYGIEPVHSILARVPVLKAIKNWRAILIASFGVAALGGLAVSALEERRGRLRAAVLTTATLAALILVVYELQQATAFRVEFMRRPSFSRALLLAAAAPVFWKLFGGLRGNTFGFAVCGLAAFDLITFGYGYTSFASPNDIFPDAPVFDFLKSHTDAIHYRVAKVRDPYPLNSPLMYGLAAVDGYDVRLLRIRQFCADYSTNLQSELSFDWDAFPLQNDRRLDMLNIRYFVVYSEDQEFTRFKQPDRYTMVFKQGHVAVFENRRALPRAFTVPLRGVEHIAELSKQLDRVKDPSFDPEQVVTTSALIPAAAGTNTALTSFESNVEVVAADANSYGFRTRGTAPAVLVVSQTYYPGWRAFVDGRETPVFDADYALTGFAIPEGQHEVRFEFAPRSVRIGLSFTLSSVALLAGMLSWDRVRRRGTSSR